MKNPQKRVPESFIRNLRIGFPPLSEQRTIAAFLDHKTAEIDRFIANKEKLIALLNEQRVAIINQAVTKGINPDVKLKRIGAEWLGDIPSYWEVKRIKRLALIVRGKFAHRPRNDPKMYDGAYPFIQTGDIASANKYITEYKQTLNEYGFTVSKQFPKGTLVMSIAANIGDVAILGFSACFPDSVVGFLPNKGVDLVYFYRNLTAMKPQLMKTAIQNTQLNLNLERIGTLFTVCPPISEQRAIANYLDCETAKIDAAIAKAQKEIDLIKEYRQALISEAVTGKIDVR